MKIIYLATGEECYVDDEDYPLLSRYSWGNNKGYAYTFISNTPQRVRIFMHNLILGKPNRGLEIDHVNSNPLDNRKDNLRIVSHSINLLNQKTRKDNPSGYKGVYPKRNGKWGARISYRGNRKELGSFFTSREASDAYENAKLEIINSWYYGRND